MPGVLMTAEDERVLDDWDGSFGGNDRVADTAADATAAAQTAAARTQLARSAAREPTPQPQGSLGEAHDLG